MARKSININLDVPMQKALLRLYRCYVRVHHAYPASLAAKVAPTDAALPGAEMPLLWQDNSLDRTDLQERSGQWVLACGIREMSEILDLLLDDLKECLAVLSTCEGGKAPGGAVNAALRASQRFKWLGTKPKLKDIAKSHDFRLSRGANKVLLSLKKIRNCLVHRLGHIGVEEVAGTRVVCAVHWRALRLFSAGKSGSVQLKPLAVIEAGDTVSARIVQKRTCFCKGDVIQFSSQDFYDAAFSARQIADEVHRKLITFAREKDCVGQQVEPNLAPDG